MCGGKIKIKTNKRTAEKEFSDNTGLKAVLSFCNIKNDAHDFYVQCNIKRELGSAVQESIA